MIFMYRKRAWRRYKNYTKAKRKRDIDLAVSWYPSFWPGFSDGEYVFPNRGMYKNLHQYSKNKIHCSCPRCSFKTNNRSRRKWYGKGGKNWKHSDLIKINKLESQLIIEN